jgi:NADP-dependent 3-hydroxy acid dehydrogenase YdfG
MAGQRLMAMTDVRVTASAIVTGGSSGIGRETALALARKERLQRVREQASRNGQSMFR